MAMFVHLTPEARVARIRRNGIRRGRAAVGRPVAGVHSVPVTRNFYVSHQWLRELKRSHAAPFAGVYFRIPDDELVYVGHYGKAHGWMTAADATRAFLTTQDPRGWEVIVPRRIEAREIHRVRRLPQVLGWRYRPGSNGTPPFCVCDFCTRGRYGGRRMRERQRAKGQ